MEFTLKIWYIFFFLLFSSCAPEEEERVYEEEIEEQEEQHELNCELISFMPEVFFIELTDADGNNLLLDGTYDAEEIVVEVDGEEVGFGNVSPYNDEAYVLIIEIDAETRNDKDYEIKLSSEETDTLRMEYTVKEAICDRKVYTAQKVIYNDEELEMDELYSNQKITIVK